MSTSDSLPALTPAMEDYLEAIYLLEKDRRIARVRDIARRLNVKMSSVSSALRSLNSRGLILYDPHQYITLTDTGVEKAKEIFRRHEVVKRFLHGVLKIDEDIAEDNACRMEHNLDPPVIDRLVAFVEFVERCPIDLTRWSEVGKKSCGECTSCVEQAKKKIRTRAKAQQAAVEEGMTLAEARPGTMVIVDSVKGTASFRKVLLSEGVESGTTAEIEGRDPQEGIVRLNIKGYHVSLKSGDAAKILVKPI